MKHATTLAAFALALTTGIALPVDSALADKGKKGHRPDYSHAHRPGHHSGYKPFRRPDHRPSRRPHHDHHHYYHGHRQPHRGGYGRPFWGYGYGCGSNLGFVYDSWTDSIRIGGGTCFY